MNGADVTMKNVDNRSIEKVIPLKEQRRLRDARIRSLYSGGKKFSMDEICKIMGVSKRTVFFAINRPKSKKKQP